MYFFKLFLLLNTLFFLNSCGIYKPTDARKFPPNPDERVAKNLEEGRGIKIFDNNKLKGTNYEFASSNELWRATLDIIDFMPLTTANYSGGIIVTDWYSDNQNLDENIKITIRFLTNEIRSDAIDIIIHKKICDQANKCQINKIENNLNSEIKFAILKKAAQLEKNDMKREKVKRGTYKIPGSNEGRESKKKD